MRIQNNLLGINTFNNNKKISGKIEKSMKKLSSGLRINMAADDAAGLSISEKMRSQIRGLDVASQNVMDAISKFQVRDGVLDEAHHVMQRMRELTIQSLNGTLSYEDKENIQKEFRELQLSIDDFTTRSQWNSKPIFEAHESSFYSFEGNQYFYKFVNIIDGYNNDLEISVDGKVTKLSVESGYYSINELIDIIDDKLIEKDKNLIVNLTKNNTVSLQSENSTSIDYIKGGLSFLFYEYHIGNPPGMVIGVTEFKENGKLFIQSGYNDKLKFYVGASKEYTINFSPNSEGYSIDELIDIINNQLEAYGENDVKAIKYLDKHIALTSDKHVITGLSGNMIRIDGITSVLYDNAKYGYITKSQGYVEGRKNLSEGITIKKGVNDILNLRINGLETYTINLLEGSEIEKHYTLDEIINHINSHNLGIEAKKVSGSYLGIYSKYFGSGSSIKIELGNTDSNTYNAYYNLFVGEQITNTKPDIVMGAETQAIIKGEHVLGGTVDIVEGKNELIVEINGNEKAIVLEVGSKGIGELVEEIKTKLNETTDLGTPNVDVTIEEHNGKYALIIKNTEIGEGTLSVLDKSNAFLDLFCETYTTGYEHNRGTTTIINPEEGIVGPPEIVETPATLRGRANLSNGVTIDNTNDILKMNISGKNIEIKLDHGDFDKNSLVNMLSDKLGEENVEVSLSNDLKNVIFTTKEKGENQFFSDIGGTAYNTIIAGTGYNIPSTSSAGSITNYSITGRTNIVDDFIIDDTNNKLKFTYIHESKQYDIEVKMSSGIYNGNGLADELREKIKEELLKNNTEEQNIFSGDEIVVDIKNSGSSKYMSLSTKGVGANYQLTGFKEGFYNNVLNSINIVKLTHIEGSGRTYAYDTYIVGREELNKEIIIHPNINDYLIFDFYRNSQKETFKLRIDPGLYNASSIVNEIQKKLSDELGKKGYPQDTLQVQIGGVDSGTAIDDANKLVIKCTSKNDGRDDRGSYIIDGVRGSAAYTVFYKSYGEPTPTHTVGIVDLSNGVSIEAGVNDTFNMDVNGETQAIILDEKEYTADELLIAINSKLNELSSMVVASYYEGRLKLSFTEVGANTIDSISGNAKGTLFFNVDAREEDNPESYQIGANAKETLIFNKSRVSNELMRINTITILNERSSEKALSRLDNAINYVSKERGRIGATQNRLESIIRNNENYKENILAAESRIRDGDLAKEIAELTKNQILQQVSHAMLAQANKKPEKILELLR